MLCEALLVALQTGLFLVRSEIFAYDSKFIQGKQYKEVKEGKNENVQVEQ